MAVPALRSGHTEAKLTTNLETLAITAPSTISDDDILLCLLSTDGTSTAQTITGFTNLNGTNGLEGASSGCTMQVFWKRASSESRD